MRAYIAAVILVASLHVYFSFVKGDSPLSIAFLILILSPFAPFAWQEASKIKLGKDGFELERLKKDVDQTIKKAVHGKAIDPRALDDLFKTVELNEWVTLVLARMLMRQGLVCLASDHDLGASPSLRKLIALCFARGLLSEEERDELERLRNVTFYAEWWGGEPPTYGDWIWALDNCKAIVRGLFEKQHIS